MGSLSVGGDFPRTEGWAVPVGTRVESGVATALDAWELVSRDSEGGIWVGLADVSNEETEAQGQGCVVVSEISVFFCVPRALAVLPPSSFESGASSPPLALGEG